ncbi:hypothetical protein BX666DRAFT_2017240 [Dichotomocladium elegans]|nr:hypothetical protein BX666DRAFT_2017240 [Dichotomocladium elegans]
MVLRFLKMGFVTFTLFSVLALPILLPLNTINQLNSDGLNLFTIGNIKDKNRLWAHLVLSVILSAGLVYLIYRETRVYLVLRRRYLLSPGYANTVTARTLYVPSIPKSTNTVAELHKIFDRFPGGVRRIWMTRDTKDLPDQIKDREKHVKGLEGAITDAISKTYKHNAKKGAEVELGGPGSHIPDKLRPTHRVTPLPVSVPCVGRKVDSIEYYRSEIKELNDKILASQRAPEQFTQLNSAFIEFNQQIAAHMAAQCVIHSQELQMAPRYLQVAPSDIIWENMNVRSIERLIRRFLSLTITGVVVIFWAIPVGFVQAVSNIETLSKLVPFLSKLNDLPATVVGIIQGILPAVALAVLVALVPVFFEYLSTKEGTPQKSAVDLAVLDKYFFFLYVDVVLLSTAVGGVLHVISAIKDNPLSIIDTLATSLPKASTFFITYVMLQAFNGTAKQMLLISSLAKSYIFPFLTKTPRDIYVQKTKAPIITLGTLVPGHTLIFVLGILYSTIAPLILPFAAFYFILSYFVYLYQFLFVYEMEYETGGLAFPRALRHVYIGLFTWQLTMIGLLAIQVAIPQLIIMAITFVASVFSMALYDLSFKPLFEFLPIQQNNKELMVSTEDAIENAEADKTKTSQDDEEVLPVDAEAASAHLRKRLKQQQSSNRSTPMGANAGAGDSDQSFAMSTARAVFDVEYYMNPSLYQAQPTVWLPEDDLGITDYEMDRLRELSIITSSEGARAVHAGNRGQKSNIVLDHGLFEEGGRGIPHEAPTPNTAKDPTQTAANSLNIVSAFALSS